MKWFFELDTLPQLNGILLGWYLPWNTLCDRTCVQNWRNEPQENRGSSNMRQTCEIPNWTKAKCYLSCVSAMGCCGALRLWATCSGSWKIQCGSLDILQWKDIHIEPWHLWALWCVVTCLLLVCWLVWLVSYSMDVLSSLFDSVCCHHCRHTPQGSPSCSH